MCMINVCVLFVLHRWDGLGWNGRILRHAKSWDRSELDSGLSTYLVLSDSIHYITERSVHTCPLLEMLTVVMQLLWRPTLSSTHQATFTLKWSQLYSTYILQFEQFTISTAPSELHNTFSRISILEFDLIVSALSKLHLIKLHPSPTLPASEKHFPQLSPPPAPSEKKSI